MHLWFMQVRDVVFVHNNLRLAHPLSSARLTTARRVWSGLKLTDSDSDCEL